MLQKVTVWRLFGFAVLLSVLAMVALNSCRGIIQLGAIKSSFHGASSPLSKPSIKLDHTLPHMHLNSASSLRINSSHPQKHAEKTKIEALNKITKYDRNIFVMDAYLIDDRRIRITTVRRCRSRQRLILHLRFNATTFSLPTQSDPISSCPWWFAKRCIFVGYFTHVTLPKQIMSTIKSDALPEALISIDEKGNSTRYALRLHDARANKSEPKHQLAVCLQPIFLLADWTILIQFFETWIVQGATKFYIYAHSMAPEVDALLRVYEADTNIDVERVHWAPLPVNKNTSADDDPNYLIYRTEVVTAVNDCVLRSRGQTKYVVSSDLDEIIVPFKNVSLLDLVHSLHHNSPKVAAFVFSSSYASFQNNWMKADGPIGIQFDNFSEVELEGYVWPTGKRSKVIMIPELILTTHVHTVLLTEKHSKIVDVREDTALVFHLRRVMKREYITVNETRISTDLARFVKPCNELWNKRSKMIQHIPGTEILHSKIWPNRGLQVMSELEKCLVEDYARRAKTCNSPFRCIDSIGTIKRNEWIWAKQTWTRL